MNSHLSRADFLRLVSLATAAAVFPSLAKGASSMAKTESLAITADPTVTAMYLLGDAGEHHRPLQALVGEWDVVMHMFPAPGATITSVGMKSRKRSILDGRQVAEEIYDGTMGGVPHRKVTMLGYNAVNHRYEFVTADNLDTQQMVYHGTRDAISGVITLTASYTQAVYAEIVAGDGLSRASGKRISHRAIGGMEMNVRDVLTIANADEHKLEMFFNRRSVRKVSGRNIFTGVGLERTSKSRASFTGLTTKTTNQEITMAEIQGFDIDEFVKTHKLGTVTAEYRKGIKPEALSKLSPTVLARNRPD